VVFYCRTLKTVYLYSTHSLTPVTHESIIAISAENLMRYRVRVTVSSGLKAREAFTDDAIAPSSVCVKPCTAVWSSPRNRLFRP